ncbi:type ISP restriction/modification enzyme [Bifidobacterium asteroides]|uniref:type ISP restriction/modification enzyme n=1 Tax=Bifidobacterium asteroides TaxID=1684 RepID=UPI0027424D74|nr:type ISP restriction/modification enzyme [Bifidobacterium asteroides]WLT10727.1 type ISP restriction/modification enzyme [Bifidobacterium asteroides]
MTVFQDVLDIIEKSPAARVEGGERIRGTAFELATKYFLTHDAAWAPIFCDVWMWSEEGNPLLTKDALGKPHNLPRNDTGIDLVARSFNGSLWAIQCKYVADDHILNQNDISSFFVTGIARKVQRGNFIIVHTGAGLTETLSAEAKEFGATIIDSSDLSGDLVDWSEFLPSASVRKFSPRPYQQKAINDCLHGFETHDRGKLIMACGTGKTLTALRLAEEMKQRRNDQFPNLRGKPFRVLFLAPSIALVSQTFKYWTHQAMDRIVGYIVCSDGTVKKREGEDTDEWLLSILDVPFPTTTDASILKRNVELSSTDDVLSVVFSTYQSIQTTIDAQRMGMPDFDLVICDEAHRTAGAADNKRKVSPFVLVHDAKLLKSNKRLYMTATPKVYADAAKDQARREDYTAYSMDDENVFGPEFHRLKFGSAVAQGILTDYRVLVLGVAQGQASNLKSEMTNTQAMRKEYDKIEDLRRKSRRPNRDELAERRRAEIAKQAQSFAGKIIGAWNGLLTRGVHNGGVLKSVDINTGLGEQVQFAVMGNQPQPQSEGKTGTQAVRPLRKAVAFTRRIADSKALADGFNDVVFRYLAQQMKSGNEVEGLLEANVKHIDGSMPAKKRSKLLSWLDEPPLEGECRILSNAKCLTEGVDLPQLDAVIFFQPRASQVDIVQAVGRVMRKAENKEYGYIILPVVVPDDSNANDVLASSDFETVWKILQSLRSHDERLDARINALSLHRQAEQNKRRRKPNKSNRVGRGDFIDQYGNDEEALNGDQGSLTAMVQGELGFDEQVSESFQAKLVQKCGDTAYWDDWADSVAKIAKTTVKAINAAIVDDAQVGTAFNIFLQGLRDTLNPGIDRDDAIGMLAQHILTAPIFDALFVQQKDSQGRSFVQANPVSQALEPITKLLEPLINKADPQHELSELYAQVRLSASAVHSDESARQALVKNLYESFFRNAFKDDSKKLGIVYTPTEIVDYIIHAVDRQLSEHFGKHIGDRGVTILDPFTGTGTFIVELLRSGLIPAENLRYKYEHEIYANEIMLLAYYIAMVNIESAFYSVQMELAKSGKVGDKGNSFYVPFPGGVLTDTFQTSEDNDTIDQSVFMANSERVQRENEQPITVIFGNPPYSAGQKSANENNANDHYETLDSRIEETYVATSSSSNKRQIYDSYIRAFRWSSDRIAGVNRDGKGIIGFVSNGGWLYSIAFNGFRKALCNEFSDIYVFNLRGNALGKGIERKKESGNVFGGGTRTSIAVTLLIRDQEADHQGIVHYRDIGDYLSRDEKLATIDESADGEEFEWQILIPDEHGDWLSQRDDSFDNYAPLALGKRKRIPGMFATYSLGINTNRDAFCYGFSFNEVQNNIQRLLKTYNSELSRWKADGRKQPIEDFVVRDAHLIKWSSSLYQLFAREKQLLYSDEHLVYSLYRPFTKKWLYYDGSLIHRIFRNLSLFPPALSTPETTSATGMHIQRETALSPFVNRVIDVSGVGNTGFSCLISEETVCLDAVQKGQCFPLYWYEAIDDSRKVPEGELDLGHASLLKPGDLIVNDSQGKRYIRHDAITDDTLRVFRAAYPDNRSLHAKDVSAAKECIFYYAYGLLHSPEYRERFSANLRKELPRIPFAADFDTYQLAGRRLATLHVEYENVERYVSTENGQNGRIVEDWSEDADHSDPGRVQKLQFGRTTKSEDNPQGKDRSTIIINDKVSLRNIPEEAYRYKVSGRSAIEWVMDQYRVKTDRASGITNDPNDWVRESGNPRYIIDLLESVVTVSIETMKIVDSLPPINAQDRPSFWPLGW